MNDHEESCHPKEDTRRICQQAGCAHLQQAYHPSSPESHGGEVWNCHQDQETGNYDPRWPLFIPV